MAKKKEEKVEKLGTEELRAKFQEKLRELLELGKKRKNILEYQEISDFFKDMNLDAEKFEKVLDFLEANNISTFQKVCYQDDYPSIVFPSYSQPYTLLPSRVYI